MLVRILQACDAFVTENPPKLSPGVKQLIETLHAKGKDVYLVSGGFRQVRSFKWRFFFFLLDFGADLERGLATGSL